MDVRMDLAQLRISEIHEQQVVILRERSGKRILQIVIGLSEALAIDRRVKGIQPARPYTHELLAAAIAALGAELEKVVINDLQDHTFFARLVIRKQGELIEVDSRPSDALALGVGVEAPIFVAEHVLREAAQTLE